MLLTRLVLLPTIRLLLFPTPSRMLVLVVRGLSCVVAVSSRLTMPSWPVEDGATGLRVCTSSSKLDITRPSPS